MTPPRPTLRALKLLEDVRDAAQFLVDDTLERTYDDLLADRRLRQSVERGFEVIGEATRRLRDEFPDVAGRLPAAARMIGTRNAIAHGYDAVDHARLWQAIQVNLPRLIVEVERLVAELGG